MKVEGEEREVRKGGEGREDYSKIFQMWKQFYYNKYHNYIEMQFSFQFNYTSIHVVYMHIHNKHFSVFGRALKAHYQINKCN